MKQSKFPVGWDEERVRRVLVHYEQQTEEEAVVEDEAAFEDHNIVCSRGDIEPALRIVTVYEPDDTLWEKDYKTRRSR